MCNCNDDFAYGGITFPGFTRYACCNPCCDGSVSAQRVESDTDDCCDCGCCKCCCPCCCKCCCHHHHDHCGNVGGVNNENNNIPPCPCRTGW